MLQQAVREARLQGAVLTPVSATIMGDRRASVAFLYGQAAAKVGMTGPAAGVRFVGGGEQ